MIFEVRNVRNYITEGPGRALRFYLDFHLLDIKLGKVKTYDPISHKNIFLNFSPWQSHHT